MMEIWLTFCLISNPTICKEQRHLVDAHQNYTPYQCIHMGTDRVLEFTKQNPDWRVSRWGCRRYRPETDA
jgi:hypothetical protein